MTVILFPRAHLLKYVNKSAAIVVHYKYIGHKIITNTMLKQQLKLNIYEYINNIYTNIMFINKKCLILTKNSMKSLINVSWLIVAFCKNRKKKERLLISGRLSLEVHNDLILILKVLSGLMSIIHFTC